MGWRVAAYLMRYGGQPWSEVQRMPMSTALTLYRALSNIIQAENGRGDDDDEHDPE